MKVIQICLVYFIMYTLLRELLPAGPFRKYMKFIGGLLFLLLFFQNLFQLQEELPALYERYYQRAEKKLETEKGKDLLYDTYKEQVEHQILEMLKESGYEPREVSIKLKDRTVDSITIRLNHEDKDQEKELKNKLKNVYSLEESHINIKS